MKLLLLFALTVFATVPKVASLHCWICEPPKQAGVRSPQCEFDSHDWGILEQCPPDADMCMTSVQVYEGTKVHLRECGKMEGGFYNIQDNCVDEITEKTSGYLCYCKEDGCNRGHGHNSASHLNISSFLALIATIISLYFAK